MANLRKTLLTGLTVLASSASAQALEAGATQVLRTAERVATTLSPCASSAADVVGEVALRLLRGHKDVLLSDSNSAYVRRSVVNARRDQLRRNKRRVLASDLVEDGDLDVLRSTAVNLETPVDVAAVTEFRESLSADDQRILTLLEDGHSDRAIARSTGLSRHAVRQGVERIQRRARHAFSVDAPALTG